MGDEVRPGVLARDAALLDAGDAIQVEGSDGREIPRVQIRLSEELSVEGGNFRLARNWIRRQERAVEKGRDD